MGGLTINMVLGSEFSLLKPVACVISTWTVDVNSHVVAIKNPSCVLVGQGTWPNTYGITQDRIVDGATEGIPTGKHHF